MAVELTPEAAPVVRRAVFPAAATLPDGSEVKLCKLFVTAERVYAYVLNGGAVELVYEQTYTTADLPPTFAPRSDLFRIDTPDGQLVARRLPGCGCHLRQLKTFAPWAPMRVSR